MNGCSRIAAAVSAGILLAAPILFAAEKKIVFSSDSVIQSNFEVPAGTTCIIKPGVRLLFEGYVSFSVRGLVIAEGTPSRPIVFSAVVRPAGSSDRPSWKGIEIIGKEANGQFRHCRFEGAYRNLVWESNPLFDSCEFAGCHYGLYCAKKAAPHVSHCRIYRNTYGIAADFSYPLLLDNIISDNIIGLYLQLCSEAIAGKNTITRNQTNIRVENAFGKNPGSTSLQSMWDVMQQLY
jgi:parallel beta-helix repeat protein